MSSKKKLKNLILKINLIYIYFLICIKIYISLDNNLNIIINKTSKKY